MIQNFTIYGERNSGTTFLEKVITQSFNIEVGWPFGWKHWGMGHFDENIQKSTDTLILCIVRNPYDWLGAMYNRPHHVIEHRKRKNIRTLLTKEWCSYGTDRNHPDFGLELIHDRDWRTRKRYSNIFALRKSKLLYFHADLPKLTNNYYLIRYEDLCHKTEFVLSDIADKFALIRNNFKPIVKIGPKYQFDTPVKNLIDSRIDWKAEKIFNYEKENRRNQI